MIGTPMKKKFPVTERSNGSGKKFKSHVLWIEGFSFLLLILFMWFDDEYLIPKIISENVPLSAKTIAGLLDSIWVLCLFIFALTIQIKNLRQIKVLEGILPVCAHCKKIRDEHQEWNQIEEYIHKRTHVDFTHTICPDCGLKLYGDLYLKATQ